VLDLTLYDYAAQGVGFFGVAMLFLSYQRNDRKWILFAQVGAMGFFAVHFALLGAYTGAAMYLIATARNGVYFFRPRRWADSIVWIWGFFAAFIIAGMFTFDSPFCLFPIAAMMVDTEALHMASPRRTRLLELVCSAAWIVYAVYERSVPAAACEVVIILFILYAVWKFDILNHKEEGHHARAKRGKAVPHRHNGARSR
jgi:hypothetical protein